MVKYCIPMFALLVQSSLVAMDEKKEHTESRRNRQPFKVRILATPKEILTPISLNIQSNPAQQQPAIKHSSSKELVYSTAHLTKKQLHQKRSFKALADECRERCNQLQYEMLVTTDPLLRCNRAYAAKVTKKFYDTFLTEKQRDSTLGLAFSSPHFNLEGYMQELECDFNALEQSCLNLNNVI